MEACELCFPVRGESEPQELVLDHIPAMPPRMRYVNWTSRPVTRKIWRFSFLGDHVLPQLIGRCFDWCDPDYPYWRDHAVFRDPDGPKCRVMLQADIVRHELLIEFDTGPERDTEGWLRVIGAYLREIIDPTGHSTRLLKRPLWQEIDAEHAPTGELDEEGRDARNRVVEALRREFDCLDNEFVRKAFEEKVADWWARRAASNLTQAQTAAWRAGIVVALMDRPGDQDTSWQPASPEAKELGPLFRKLESEYAGVQKALAFGRALGDYDNFRKRYKEAHTKCYPFFARELIGDMGRHARPLNEQGPTHLKRDEW